MLPYLVHLEFGVQSIPAGNSPSAIEIHLRKSLVAGLAIKNASKQTIEKTN